MTTTYIGVDVSKKTLNSQIIIALADHFQISLDEMIGRIPPTKNMDSLPKRE
ncbi:MULTISPECIES: hypothetical protein [unclassified Candidatus Tisiphia]|nr:hypothetical protein [Rickettsiaceae bacterium]MDD9337544.1 hypothetical protein [Rickettsiaceae bacterium]